VSRREAITPPSETVNKRSPITTERRIAGVEPFAGSCVIRPSSAMPDLSTRKPIAPTNPELGALDAWPPPAAPGEPLAGCGGPGCGGPLGGE
jgi:hypothetical protein